MEKTKQQGVVRELMKTGLPIFAELFFISLFAMVDMALLKSCGTTVIAAVGLTAEPMNLLEFSFWAMQTAAVAMLSVCFAKKDHTRIRRLFVGFMKLVAGAALILAILFAVFAEPVLRICGALGDTLPTALIYLRIGLIAFVFRRLYSAMTDMLKALGVPQWSFWISLLSNVVNVIFDVLLIFGIGPFPALGATGAALATLIGCVTGFICASLILFRRMHQLEVHISIRDWRISSRRDIIDICKTAAPMVSEKVMIRLGVFLTVRRVALLGASDFATYRILLSLQLFALLGSEAISTTMLIFGSRAFAKRDAGEARSYFRGALGCTLAYALIWCVVFTLFGRQFVGLYSEDTAVITLGARLLMVVVVFQPFQSMALLYAGAMRSCGLAKIPTVVTTIGIVAIRPILVYLLIPLFGVLGAWLAIGADEIFRFFALQARRKKLWLTFASKEVETHQL